MIGLFAPGRCCDVAARVSPGSVPGQGKRQGRPHDLLAGGVANRHLEVGTVTVVPDMLRGDGRKSLHHLPAHLLDAVELRPLVVGESAVPVPKVEEVAVDQAACRRCR